MIHKTVKNGVWLSAGVLFLLLALIGLLLPVIPQLPFFIAAVFCFMRCSSRFTAWMHRQHWFERMKQHHARRKKDDSSSID